MIKIVVETPEGTDSEACCAVAFSLMNNNPNMEMVTLRFVRSLKEACEIRLTRHDLKPSGAFGIFLETVQDTLRDFKEGTPTEHHG